MKLLIADDEDIVREGLKQIINWQELGFNICGEAANGEEALKKVLALQPDLILLDIKMPKLSGIELIQKSREQGYSGHFILLSGYSDFTYAQSAIRYGVDNYLIKPIDEDELTKAVTEVKTTILKKQQKSSDFAQYREKARENIVRSFLLGEDEPASLNLSDFGLDADQFMAVLYERYNQESFEPWWDFADLLRVTNQNHNSFDHVILDGKNIILLKGSFAINRFYAMLDHYKTVPQKGSPLDSLFLIYGRPVSYVNEIRFTYQDTLSLLKRRFFCSEGQHVLHYMNLPADLVFTDTIDAMKPENYPQIITGYLQAHNRSMLVETLHKIENRLYYSVETETAIKHFLIDLILQVKQNICHIYHTLDIPFPSNTTIISFIERRYYLYEIIRFISEQFDMCQRAIGNPTGENIIDDVLYYIRHNYSENLKLEGIAALFGYNSSYLGKMFTKKTGESFNSYLDRIRIDESRRLLAKSELKIYEIAERIGYKSVDYFHKKFKKYTGMSPAEYRKQILEKF